MAERQLAAKSMLLYMGTGAGSPEIFELIACSTSHGLNQSSSPITTETFCGQLSVPGTKDATAPFAMIPNIDPAAGKVALDTLQTAYAAGTAKNWKMTTAGQAAGDPIISFTGFISEFNYDASGDFFNTSGSVQVSPESVELEFVP